MEYPKCMVGNQMDTTCTAIITENTLTISNKGIADITGVEYFDDFNTLDCSDNLITFIGKLPNGLNSITADDNQIFYVSVD